MAIVFSFLFAGAGFCSERKDFDQEKFNKAIVTDIIYLSAIIIDARKKNDVSMECEFRSLRQDKYESYFAQPKKDEWLTVAYAVSYFQEALEQEKLCSSNQQKNRYNFLRYEYFGRMQDTIFAELEKCITAMVSTPDDPFAYRYTGTYINILSEFDKHMSPEELTRLSQLKAISDNR
ncbi:TPA: hypothetical protein DDY55_03875 [Candidatus Falkowbacteria bacterium]|nr:hypothetical protein [Candidatus Falkowbacteria bacterium]HAY12066.1 hypothetical protein [Candidatus Falkowbacteria bacterium]HBI97227.1 hypothetical protein [Candidatus Falkowbacteria bacterium]HBT27970.1 hypothetical protein [Candidatus Falkowbacteria bacterium]HBY14434.1 hypothetical protein [Candidatus Falkowbacteria bacterium]